MNIPKVSVLICNYNFATFVEQAARSALSQDYPNFEIVMADDGSTDQSPQIIRDLAASDSRIVTHFSLANEGITSIWNKGVARCSGDYIAFLAADDLMLPGKLSKQVEFMEKHPDFGCCTHEMEIFDSETGEAKGTTQAMYAMPREAGIEALFATNWFFRKPQQTIPSSSMARSSFIKKFEFSSELKYWNECLHMIDCVAATGMKLGHLPEILGRYRVHGRQTHTSAAAREVSFREALLMLQLAEQRYPQHAKLIKSKRDFILFQHLLFDWHAEGERSAREKHFLEKAGLMKWLYLKACRFYLSHKAFRSLAWPVKKLVKSLF